METKPFFLFDWDPVIFNNGKIYIIGNGGSDGHIRAYKKSYNLVKLDNIEVYENLFFDHSKEHIDVFQREFIEATVNQQYRENSAARQALEENAVLSFIVRKVLPALTRKKEQEEIDNILGINPEAKEKEDTQVEANLAGVISDIDVRQDNALIEALIRQVEQEYACEEECRRTGPEPSQIEEILGRQFRYKRRGASPRIENAIADILEGHVSAPVKRGYVEQDTDESIFKQFLSGPTAIFVGRVYDLVSASEKNGFDIFLGDQKYGAQYKVPLERLFEKYSRMLEKKFKIDALRNNGNESTALAHAQRERDALRSLLQANNFEKAGIGFMKKRNLYYVYVDTPEKYALKSPHNGKHYLFKKARIGVSLKKEEDRIYVNNPLILGSYHHPFIKGPSSDLAICLGDYSYERTRRLPPLESVLTFLSDAKNVILSGYGTGGCPHRRLVDENFHGQEVSDVQIKKENIPVTNKAVVGRYRRCD